MIELNIRTIQQVLQATVIQGERPFLVKHVRHYDSTPLEHSHTLLFVRKNDELDWTFLQTKKPVAIVTDQPLERLQNAPDSIMILHVPQTLRAFWQFVRFYRSKLTIPVVAITGTCGKTTTKEMVRHMLRKDWDIQATVSSQNEPRRSLAYLTGIGRQTKAAVFELGLGNSGNISHQCRIYQPTIGVITNIGVHHLDGCQTLDGYIQAKGEIIEELPQDGTLIVHAEDTNIKKLPIKKFKGTLYTFGTAEQADFKAEHLQYKGNNMVFTLRTKDARYKVTVPGIGEHQVYNALAAIATVFVMGYPLRQAIAQLATFQPLERHLQFSTGFAGSTIIDDTWTNNPTSIEAALHVLQQVGRQRKKIVLLGDINRLGTYEKHYHQQIGTVVAQQNIDLLITIGKKAKEIGRQVKRQNPSATVYMYDKVEEGLFAQLQAKLNRNTIVLIKGPMSSRALIGLAEQLKGK